MYDSYRYTKDYKKLKDLVIAVLNNDSDYSEEEVMIMLDESYQNDDLTTQQYDELCGYISDLL